MASSSALRHSSISSSPRVPTPRSQASQGGIPTRSLWRRWQAIPLAFRARSEEHTSELQSRSDLVCRLLLEKKKHLITHHDNDAPFRTPYRRRLARAPHPQAALTSRHRSRTPARVRSSTTHRLLSRASHYRL